MNALHLCPRTGNDNWSGFLPAADPAQFDGPMRTLPAALVRVRQLRRQFASQAQFTIWLRGGDYCLPGTLQIVPEDSGVTFRAWPEETPVLTGGRRVEGWREITLPNGCAAFLADAPDFFSCTQYPHSLYVHGRRASRPRSPHEGWRWMESVPGLDLAAPFNLFTSHQQFHYQPGDIDPAWRNFTDIDVIVSHFWVIERMPLSACVPEQRLVTSSRRSLFPLRDAWDNRFAKYYLENVFEGLAHPGEFYADRAAGQLYYVPRPGESAATLEAIVPVARQIVRIAGTAEEPVRGVEFHGVHFAHTEVQHPDSIFQRADSSRHFRTQCPEHPGTAPFATFPQAAGNVSAAVRLDYVRLCALVDCTIAHTGGYAIQLLEGAQQCRVQACTLHDLGAGGVMLDGGDLRSPVADQNSHHLITDCRIHDAGHVFPAAVGILAMHSFRNRIAHNEIYDLSYSGISCGWVWGYDENISRENRIEFNRIHHLGQRGGLSDMGGIYLLGMQPGTVVRGNVIHDVAAANYGAWCLYLDEGSSLITVEGNVCLGPASNALFEHWGRQNLIRHNLFATEPIPGHPGSLMGLCGERDIWRCVDYPRPGATLTGNIFLTHGQPFLSDNQRKLSQNDLSSDLNLFWDRVTQSAPAIYFRDEPWKHLLAPGETGGITDLTLAKAQERGLDRHSIVADPQILELTPTAFRCADSSPLHTLQIPLPRPELAGPQRNQNVS